MITPAQLKNLKFGDCLRIVKHDGIEPHWLAHSKLCRFVGLSRDQTAMVVAPINSRHYNLFPDWAYGCYKFELYTPNCPEYLKFPNKNN